MSQHTQNSHIEYPLVNLSHESRERARFLINTYYTERYGKEIRYESPSSIRVKILELRVCMDPLRKSQPLLYMAMAKQCVDFERICALLEILS